MAYNAVPEKELMRIEKNDKGEFVVIKKIGDDTTDIRQYYTADDGEVYPTKKGIRFSNDILRDVILTLCESKGLDEDTISQIDALIYD